MFEIIRQNTLRIFKYLISLNVGKLRRSGNVYLSIRNHWIKFNVGKVTPDFGLPSFPTFNDFKYLGNSGSSAPKGGAFLSGVRLPWVPMISRN